VFDEADLVIGNLETCLSLSSPLRHRQEVIGGTYNCNTHPLYLDAVKDAGIHAVVTANNHCLDAGINGIQETLDVLSKQNIPSTGVFLSSNSKRHMLLGVNGIVIGVLSYSGAGFNGKSRALTPEQKYMINPYSIEALTKDLRAVQADGANLVFVYMHWGLEHTSYVTKQQEEIAHQIAESDVSLIIGSHPHVLQKAGNIQVKNGNFVPIIYSLGNFISDMRYVDENRITAIAHLYLNTKTNSIEKVEFTPCVILDEYKGEDYVIMPLKENNIKRLDKIIEGYGSSCYASAMQVLGDFRMGINDLPGRPR
jgi:poly-gamma-glutamate synthesis protein (capsule biosynthesis protein)